MTKETIDYLQAAQSAVAVFEKDSTPAAAQLALEQLGVCRFVTGCVPDIDEHQHNRIFRKALKSQMTKTWEHRSLPEDDYDLETQQHFLGRERAAISYAFYVLYNNHNSKLARYYNEFVQLNKNLEEARAQLCLSMYD